ncbi:MAG: flavodoxin family protein [Acidobacteriota bacterium]|nr:flavodoxin family protein [Acidobacteriota bacterium]
MARNVVAIVGSYRRGGTVDRLVDAVLNGARDQGAQTSKIILTEKHIEYCRNCRNCTQAEGVERGHCAVQDDMQSILAELDAADAIVLGAPVNYYNVTAVFRVFLERLLGAAFWPWGQWSPAMRSRDLPRKAVLVSSLAAPRWFIYLTTGAPKALRVTAQCLGARPVARIFHGLSAGNQKPELSEKVLRRAYQTGSAL